MIHLREKVPKMLPKNSNSYIDNIRYTKGGRSKLYLDLTIQANVIPTQDKSLDRSKLFHDLTLQTNLIPTQDKSLDIVT